MLPEALHKFFWEYDAKVLDEKVNWFQIIERILEYGDLNAVRWIYRSYSSEQLADVVRKSRQLSKRTALLWQNILGIPEEEITCLKISCQRSDIPFLKS
ncbi:MAG: DUF6922 domain-containing protein [Bacillota bacterium]